MKGQPCKYQEIGLDGGYDIGAVHRGLELLGGQGYTAIREYQNNAMKKGFCYEEETDRFVCRQGKHLAFQKLIYKKSTQNYYRLYSRSKKHRTNNVKTVRILHLVLQISVQSGSMQVLIIPFIETARK